MTPKSSIFGKIPFLRYTIAMVTGILLSGFIKYRPHHILFLIITLLIFIILLINKQQFVRYRNWALSLVAFLLFTMLGVFYTSYFRHHQYDQYLPENAQYIGTVTDKSPSTNNRLRYVVKLKAATTNDSTYILHEQMVLFSADSLANTLIVPGSQISFKTKLFPISTNNNPGEFNYKKFMLQKGIRVQAFINKGVVIIPHKDHSLKTLALNLRAKLLEKYAAYSIADQEFAVLAALTLGEKSYLSSDTRISFSSSGAMHVLAVSGLHVGIIFMVINALLKPLKYSKNTGLIKILITLSLLWVYAFITGLSPSVLRACTMFSFVSVGENINRRTNIYNALAVSAFVLMLINPNIILEVGFQLSYAAVISIVFFQPKITSIFNVENRFFKYLWDLLAVSVAAQIGTFPISLFYFHQFPVYFWISNFLVIPAAAILLYGAVLFFASSFIPLIPNVLAYLLTAILKLTNSGVKAIEQLPGSVIQNIWIDQLTMLLLIAIIVSIGWFIVEKQFKIIIYSLLALVCLVAYSTYNNIKTLNQTVLIFYNNYNDKLISFIDGNNHYYYTPSDSLKGNTINMIENASGFFHTKKAKELNETSGFENLAIRNNNLFFKTIKIEISTSTSQQKTKPFEYDFEWNPNRSTIVILNHKIPDINVLKNGRIKPLIPTFDTDTIMTKNTGALIIFW